MSFTASFGNDLKKLEKSLLDLGDRGARKAVSISASEAIRHSKAVAKRTITDTYAIKSSDVAKTLKTKNASMNDLFAQLTVTSPNLPIYDFQVRPNRPQFKNIKQRKELQVTIVKGQTKSFPGAFVADMHSGHTGVFTRVGKNRLPIRERYTIGPASMVFAERTHDHVINDASDYFQKRLIHNIEAKIAGWIK